MTGLRRATDHPAVAAATATEMAARVESVQMTVSIRIGFTVPPRDRPLPATPTQP